MGRRRGGRKEGVTARYGGPFQGLSTADKKAKRGERMRRGRRRKKLAKCVQNRRDKMDNGHIIFFEIRREREKVHVGRGGGGDKKRGA